MSPPPERTSGQLRAIAAGGFALDWLLRFLFPRLAYRLRWPTRLRGRVLAAYLVVRSVVWAAGVQWLLGFARTQHERNQRERAVLAERLGREPTDGELFEHMMALSGGQGP